MADIENRPLRVFLCHAHEDKATVRDLYRQLCAEGWLDVWLDEEKLLPGQEWDIEIEKAVEAADIVLVCLSRRSTDKEGYIQKEMRFVLNIAEEKPEGTIFVIPMKLEECEVPRRLRAWQWVDYFPADRRAWAYQRLLESLKMRAGKLGISTIKPAEEISRRDAEEKTRKEKEAQDKKAAEELKRKQDEENARLVGEAREKKAAEERMQKAFEKTQPEKTISSIFGVVSRTQNMPVLVSSDTSVSAGLIVDSGALKAMMKGANLYPVGILDSIGSFSLGAKVALYDQSRVLIAEGIAQYGSSEIKKIKGKQSTQIRQLVNVYRGDAVVLIGSVSWKTQIIQDASSKAGILVDIGAIRAMRAGSNLLPIGVIDVIGQFMAGANINIFDSNGYLVAQAISEYSSDEIKKIMGKHSSSIISSIGVYRGDMIVRNHSAIWT